jgi:hypothetical protein
MKYETDPQGNRAWFAGELAKMRSLIDDANARARAAQADLRDYQSQQQLVDGTSQLSVASYAVTVAPTKLVRSGGVVTFEACFNTTTSVSAGARLCTLPPGFRPMLQGTGDNGFGGMAYNGSAWVAAGFYVSNSTFDLFILTTGLPNGGSARFCVPWPALA